VVIALFALGILPLLWRAFDLQVLDHEFLSRQGSDRHLRVLDLPAHRGTIKDRHGEPLAVSTPVHSVWADPRILRPDSPLVGRLGQAMGAVRDSINAKLREPDGRAFVYLRRQVSPTTARAVTELSIPGVHLQREYRRFYPAGAVFGHVIGFTDIDDHGQEGIELAYDQWLRGIPGRSRVVRDGQRRLVETIEELAGPRPGHDLELSLDRRLQHLLYHELARAVAANQANAGSAVILDVRSGEVLAMANQPAYNPNTRRDLRGELYRNRAVTDPVEPGSTVKPFTIVTGLESGAYTPATPIDTGDGRLKVGRKVVRDTSRHGVIDVTTVLSKSSNVGVTRIAMSLPPERLWETFSRVGFGQSTGSGFPGEAAGLLRDFRNWVPVDHATHSYGYGLSVTPLQLARAYAAIASGGRIRPVSFVRLEQAPEGRQVMSADTAHKLLRMLETVVTADGTGARASVPGYRVAGKTGTAIKAGANGYSAGHYRAAFVGILPASAPQIVMVVSIDEPDAGVYYGGQVAAPVFARVMNGAVRLLDIPPDDLKSLHRRGWPPEKGA
jgi:cell division protein FtsI (penicillin-binding protein 3)